VKDAEQLQKLPLLSTIYIRVKEGALFRIFGLVLIRRPIEKFSLRALEIHG
jgi:hypothetical protein